MPVWYSYEPGGELHVWTGNSTRKASRRQRCAVDGALIRSAGRFSLVVQDPRPPYKYVSVEGFVVGIEPAQLERDIRPLAHRYLGVEEGERYIASIGGSTAGQGDILSGNLPIRMYPERWLSADYSLES